MSRRVAVVGLLMVIVGLIVVPIAIAGGSNGATVDPVTLPSADETDRLEDRPQPADSQPALLQQTTGDFDRTLFSIHVFENGSARWTFQYTRLLENETEEANFEGFAADFRTNETELYRQFVKQAQALTAAGSNVTGRPMNATAFDRGARVTPFGNRGIVEMSFTWTNFGQQREDGGVLISDVFEGGIYIRSDQRLRFVTGPGLAFETVDPQPTNTSGPTLPESEWVAWTGEQSFADRRPTVTFQPASAVRTEATDGAGTTLSEDTTNAGEGSTDGSETDRTTTAAGDASTGIGMLVTIAALALVALGVVVAAWVNGYLEPAEDETIATDDDSGDDPAGTAATDTSSGAETALLDDEDRVRQLLEDNGGRMKQTEIVDATEWSKSKVSMLLSEMEEEGEITKLRVGRENIISLPGAEPEAARSPFEDLDDDPP
ncbi:helix-turn-helix transcriptional regulator [Halorhabdus amylolytica]|uniref:helix-turn-helix transcriptional regulator n=1 Tax=Halorhabdus amylolytica TaxID=2559573 RepID=UPI0010A9A2C1|nr:helix-turn-helix domain-containing protein [Halorhabdus amylolytica]